MKTLNSMQKMTIGQEMEIVKIQSSRAKKKENKHKCK
jgi:hypothetical protein